MANYVITPANVLRGPGARLRWGVAGATIAAGQTIYRDATIKLATRNAVATARCDGIAVASAAIGQPIPYVDAGEVILAAAPLDVAGVPVWLANAQGAIAPTADLSALSGFWTLLGFMRDDGLAISLALVKSPYEFET